MLGALILLAVSLCANERSFYEILNVNRKASQSELKKAYHKLSVQYHPDRCSDDEKEQCTAKFQEISRAYETLTTPEKREIYDNGGEEALIQHENNNNPNQFAMFGQQAQMKGMPMRLVVRVSLEELYVGFSRSIKITKKVKCDHCGGSGADSPKHLHVCKRCNGQGVVIERRQFMPNMWQQFQIVCPECGGVGKRITQPCHVCHGTKLKSTDDYAFVEVLPGTMAGKEFVFEGLGDQPDNFNAQPGDVVVVLDQRKHDRFVREKNGVHLRYKLEISLAEAFFGVSREIVHLDNHKVAVRRSGTIQPNEVLRIPREGMPVEGQDGAFGDLFVTFAVKLPDVSQLSDAEKAQLRTMLSRF